MDFQAFVIFKLPGKGRKHRRVDLISAPRERYAAAVLSWSGSMMFERDLTGTLPGPVLIVSTGDMLRTCESCIWRGERELIDTVAD